MKRNIRKTPKSYVMWAVYNWGIIRDVYRTRREALEWCRSEAEYYASSDHKRCDWRDMWEIHKVQVTKI